MFKEVSNDLMIGMEIDIRRTDGRIHSAIISSVDERSQIVSVEWYEKGEAKGKELDLDEVLHLNPTIHFTNTLKVNETITENVEVGNIKESMVKARDLTVTKSSISIDNKSLNFNKINDNDQSGHIDQIRIINSNQKKKPEIRSRRRMTGISELLKSSKKKERSTELISNKEKEIEVQINSNFTIENIQKYTIKLEETKENNILTQNNSEINYEQIYICVKKTNFGNKVKDDILTFCGGNKIIVKPNLDLTQNSEFKFDYVFDEITTTERIFECTLKNFIRKLFLGNNCAYFSYGTNDLITKQLLQYSSGSSDCKGIIYLTAEEILKINKINYLKKFQIEISFYEMYNGKVFDLLKRREKIKISDNLKSFELCLTTESIENIEDIIDFLNIGIDYLNLKNNEYKSCIIFQIILKNNNCIISKCCFIDIVWIDFNDILMASQRNKRMTALYMNNICQSIKEFIFFLVKKDKRAEIDAKLFLYLGELFNSSETNVTFIANIKSSSKFNNYSMDIIQFTSDLMDSKICSKENKKEKPHIQTDSLEQIKINDLIKQEEEKVIELHKDLLKKCLPLWNKTHKHIYKTSRRVDNNLDEYAKILECSLDLQIESIKEFKENVKKLNQYLKDEEKLSKHRKI